MKKKSPLTYEQQIDNLTKKFGRSEANMSDFHGVVAFRGFDSNFTLSSEAVMGANGVGLTANPNDEKAEFTNDKGFSKGLVCTSLSADTAARYAGKGGIVYITSIDKGVNVSRDFNNTNDSFGQGGNEQQIACPNIKANRIIGCVKVEEYDKASGMVKFGKIEWSETFLKSQNLTKSDAAKIDSKDMLSQSEIYVSETSVNSITNAQLHKVKESPFVEKGEKPSEEPYHAFNNIKHNKLREQFVDASKKLAPALKTSSFGLVSDNKKKDFNQSLEQLNEKSDLGFAQFADAHNKSPKTLEADKKINAVKDSRPSSIASQAKEEKSSVSELSNILKDLKTHKSEIVSMSTETSVEKLPTIKAKSTSNQHSL